DAMSLMCYDDNLSDLERLDSSCAQLLDEPLRRRCRKQRFFSTPRDVEHCTVLCDNEVKEPQLRTQGEQLDKSSSCQLDGTAPGGWQALERARRCIRQVVFARGGAVVVYCQCQVPHRCLCDPRWFPWKARTQRTSRKAGIAASRLFDRGAEKARLAYVCRVLCGGLAEHEATRDR